MSSFDIGFIGTGPEPDNPVWGESAAMAYNHANGYERLDNCTIVACADIVRENAEDFANVYDIPENRIYEDYDEMLKEATPDVVSVSTPVPTHAPIVIDCIRSGVPAAIHCEKPMATTWGDAKRMAETAIRHDVQLTFNHQRRMAPPWRLAKDLLDDGEIGTLQRIELSGGELFDMSTHFIDLANHYNDQKSIEWVLGNIDYREEHIKYGAHNENQSLAVWAYENGVHGFASTGVGKEVVAANLRLLGSNGCIEVHPADADTELRVRSAGEDGWRSIDFESEHTAIQLAIEHVIDCLDQDVEPELSAANALDCTEVIFGTYESARRRGRVEFPLDVDDNPLEAMVESGALTPRSDEDGS